MGYLFDIIPIIRTTQRVLNSSLEFARRHSIRCHPEARGLLFSKINQFQEGNFRLVARYAHLAAEHLVPFADRLGALRVVASESDGTNTAQA